eukprot:TRINITY_DN261_c0_g1_i1.p1 TRINITY_DN261_c0_g1~~TRINITY_DN261_c0_g1_i1.p1  ORF type:complete len:1135 (+),score=425.73 TRINITY_DN261_c0_g1_i1:3053-6457(+)
MESQEMMSLQQLGLAKEDSSHVDAEKIVTRTDECDTMEIDKVAPKPISSDLGKSQDELSEGEIIDNGSIGTENELNQSGGIKNSSDQEVEARNVSEGNLTEGDQHKSYLSNSTDHAADSKTKNREELNKDKGHGHEQCVSRDQHDHMEEKYRSKDKEKDMKQEASKQEEGDASYRHKDKGKGNERVRGKEKSKEKWRDEDRKRERIKDHLIEKQREKIKDCDKDGISENDTDTSKNQKERENEKSTEWRVKDIDKCKEKDRENDRLRDKGRERDHGRERSREKGRERNRDKEKEKERDREKDKVRDKEKQLSKDREREKAKEHRKEERNKERDRTKGKGREREKEKHSDRDGRERDRSSHRENDRDKERENLRGKDREKDQNETTREKERGRERGKERDREGGKEREKERDREGLRIKDRDREKVRNQDHDFSSERDKEGEHSRVREKEVKDSGKLKINDEVFHEDDAKEKRRRKDKETAEERIGKDSGHGHASASELQERLNRIKEEQSKSKSNDESEILAWVNKSRKLQERKNAEKEKAVRLAKIFEEQDQDIIEGSASDDEEQTNDIGNSLAGLKVLHGLDKVMEGGAVVLTLKDQSILEGDAINEHGDMLENIEIAEQKARRDAYKAAKKKPGIYEDKFENDIETDKTILPQYDEPSKEEGVTLDERGEISEGAQKKLEEVRRRLQGTSVRNQTESLAQLPSMASDYYTHEEMLQFKKPKKKKVLRKREKLDLDALAAETASDSLGAKDRGSRKDTDRQALKEAAKKEAADQRQRAYQSAYKKAQEASRVLQEGMPSSVMQEDEDTAVFGAEEEELYKSLEKARKEALKKQSVNIASGPQAIAQMAVSASQSTGGDDNHPTDTQENKVVFTEMEEFVWGLQLDDDSHKPIVDDVFKEEDEASEPTKQDEPEDATVGWMEMDEIDTSHSNEKKDDIKLDNVITEAPVGKGLGGALQLLKERGSLNETVEWGGRNMDKKKSKLAGIRDNEGPKEIHLDRLDEFGRIMTPKEAFRKLSHIFHGKGPGKMKQEKRMKQYQEELKLKKMTTGDTPMMSMEKMRDIQAKLQAPYLVLSGQVKPGEISDLRSGFATVEKEVPGSLTPMLGDKKVEHFLGIKRKPEEKSMGPAKKQKK